VLVVTSGQGKRLLRRTLQLSKRLKLELHLSRVAKRRGSTIHILLVAKVGGKVRRVSAAGTFR
jgi:hypothetical protein